MEKRRGHIYLKKLQKQWIAIGLISQLFISIAVAVVSITLLSKFSPVGLWWIIPGTLLILLTIILWTGILRTSLKDISRILNSSFPALEESTHLLLKPESSMNLLEKLQADKIEQEISAVSANRLVNNRLSFAGNVLMAALIVAFGLGQLNSFSSTDTMTNAERRGITKAAKPDKILPGIKSLEVRISPPVYTRKKARQQSQFSLSAEDGSSLHWQIRTSQPVKNFKFIFNDKESVQLRALNKERTSWGLTRTVSKSGFYQVDLDGELSDLYKLEVIKDQAPVIRILRPGQYSSIDFGEPQRTALSLEINDDYGINDAFISATISSGKGEGVKFREQKLSFQQNFTGAATYKPNRTIDLQGLGMVPGDELYFYVQARDTRQQDSRSDIYIVTIQDTAQLMSMDGMIGGVNLVPEYFRSQRQIIIDTEKLLKEKSSITPQEFNSRSNDIGVDQKLLRLRYGKFLGEEDETEIGGQQEEPGDPADFGNPEAMLDAVSHKHDQAEDATFFEPELKAQLKATLAEMWKSELQLRLYKPAEALPFEYKALRLLKDLQQKSRVYVAKTSFKPPLIKADKRLTGELDKILQPQARRTSDEKLDPQNSLKLAAGILADPKSKVKLDPSEILTLNDASRQLAVFAANQPAIYLEPLGTLRAIIRSGNLNTKSIKLPPLQAALQKIIKQESRTPQAKINTPATGLSKEYFNNLRRNR